MGLLKNYFYEYLSSEDFDLMFDDEYELWLDRQEKQKKLFLSQQNDLILQQTKIKENERKNEPKNC